MYTYTETLLQTDDVRHSSLCTEQLLHRSSHAQMLLHREVCAERSFYTQTPLYTLKEAFTHRSFHTLMLCTRMPMHSAALTHSRLCTHTHTAAFTHRRFRTHRSFYTEKPLHRTAFTQRSFPPPNKKKQANRYLSLDSFSFPAVSLLDNEC